MSTHLLSIAEEIADRVGIVDQGRLRFLGTIDELRARVASRETSLEHLYLSFTAPEAAAAAMSDGAPRTAALEEGRTS
jgi:ABC-2 type transport system ATP-binding protein